MFNHENLKGRVAVVTGGGGVLCGGFAKDLARQGVKVAVLDLREEFEKCVIKPFIEDYQNARTPNPCIICNPLVKFKYLLKTAAILNIVNGYEFQ